MPVEISPVIKVRTPSFIVYYASDLLYKHFANALLVWQTFLFKARHTLYFPIVLAICTTNCRDIIWIQEK